MAKSRNLQPPKPRNPVARALTLCRGHEVFRNRKREKTPKHKKRFWLEQGDLEDWDWG